MSDLGADGRRAADYEINQHSQDIAVLKNDMQRMGEFFGRLDVAIEKIGDLSNTITKMLAVHDSRLDQQDETNKEIYATIEKSQLQIGQDIKDLYRLLNSTKNDVTAAVASFEGKATAIVTTGTEKLEKRLTALEKWRWVIVGGGAVLAAIAVSPAILNILNLLK